MTVVEALPGGGWYSKILLPFLGDDGALIGASYTIDMRRLFGFYSEERLKELETWDTDWPANAATWIDGNNTPISAFFFGSMPQATQATADAVLFIRALHNLARFEDQGGYLTSALADAYAILKPGGVVGVVQHQMREDAPDGWAQGNRGYLKQSFVIEQMEQAGFVLRAPPRSMLIRRISPKTATSFGACRRPSWVAGTIRKRKLPCRPLASLTV